MNKEWSNTKEGKEALQKLTNGVPRDELAEVHLTMALREARRELTLQDLSRILKDTLPAEELGAVCRILLKD